MVNFYNQESNTTEETLEHALQEETRSCVQFSMNYQDIERPLSSYLSQGLIASIVNMESYTGIPINASLLSNAIFLQRELLNLPDGITQNNIQNLNNQLDENDNSSLVLTHNNVRNINCISKLVLLTGGSIFGAILYFVYNNMSIIEEKVSIAGESIQEFQDLILS